jgi:hypothetical protein
MAHADLHGHAHEQRRRSIPAPLKPGLHRPGIGRKPAKAGRLQRGIGVLASGSVRLLGVVASNTASGIGTLVQGGAKFELALTAASFTATKTAVVNLIPRLVDGGTPVLGLTGARAAVREMQGGATVTA